MVPAARHPVTTANMLTNLAVSAELFHTDGTAFADLMIDGHRETWPVRSLRLRSWLRRKYYEATGAAPGAGAISSALNLLEARPPIRFRRAAGMLSLPVPVRGGSIEALSPFFNLPTRSDFVLVVAWLLAALRHGGPYPLLAARP